MDRLKLYFLPIWPFVCGLFFFHLTGCRPEMPITSVITIDAESVTLSTNKELYGLSFEEINHAIDGGIYAELIQNRSFEDGVPPLNCPFDASRNLLITPNGWTLPFIKPDSIPGWHCLSPNTNIYPDSKELINDANKRSLLVSANASAEGGRGGVVAEGYKGIPLRKGEKYNLSLFIKGATITPKTVHVTLEDSVKASVLSDIASFPASYEWKQFYHTFTANRDVDNAVLTISVDTSAIFWLDMVSLLPEKTWNGRPNGLRADLLEKVKALNPAFIRFRGGSFVEGYTAGTYQVWKETIGNVLLNLDYYDGEDAYSDGSIEDRLLEIVKTTPKEDYQKVILTEKSWPIFYHLSPERENILDWYEWKDDASVFEVGAGCGAISGVLCRNAKRVVANDLSKRRSTINAYKNQDASNLEIMVGNFNVVAEKMEERFDYVTLIGVLEYAKSYIGKDNPYPEYLEKINRLLKPGGKILIAIENRLGLKYFAGCREDHVGREFVGIEGYPGIDFVETFSKPELEQILQENGFSKFKFYYPYPDYKFPAVIYSDEYLPKPGELRKNQRNFDADRITLFDEGKAFDGILKSGLFPVFSNSFLIEVEKKE